MSDKKEDFALYCPVKNEEARKRLGIKAGFFWATAKKLSVAVSRCIAAMDDKGYDEDDFKKPVRVNYPVVNDLPPEGVFDTEFCNRYEKGGQGGITMVLIPGAVPADQMHGEVGRDITGSGNADADAGTDADNATDNTESTLLPAYAYNVNGELMSEVEKEMSQPVSGLSLPLRFLAQFNNDCPQHQVTPERLRELNLTEQDPDSRTGTILLAIQNRKEQLEKLDTKNLHPLATYIEKVIPCGKRPQLNDVINFIDAVLNTDYVDRGLLVKEWCEGRRAACVEHVTAPETRRDNTVSAQTETKTTVTERPRRSEKTTHRTINYEIGCGLYDGELDLHNLREPLDFAKRIMAKDREDWKVWSDTINCIPGILNYDRQTIIEMVRKAPTPTYHSAALRREWCDSYLRAWGRLDPDWSQSAAVKTAESHEDVCADIRKAGKRLREIESGVGINEEKQTTQGELADEPSAPESVEPASVEHQQNTQPLDAEASVNTTKTEFDVFALMQNSSVYGDSSAYGSKNTQETTSNVQVQDAEKDEKQAGTEVQSGESSLGTGEESDTRQQADVNQNTDSVAQNSDSVNQTEPVLAQTEPEVQSDEPAVVYPAYFEPGRYEGLPNEVYHAANGISSTMVKDARVSLMYFNARHVEKTIIKERSPVLDIGNLVHALALQPEQLDEEFSIEPVIPEGAFTTTATIRAFIDEHNASLTAMLSADDIKALLEEYNATLPAQVQLGGSVEETGQSYMSLPEEFQRLEADKKQTAAAMKACIKEYNTTLPAQVKISGSRDALLEQLAIINPDLVAQEAQKPAQLKVSGTKADLIQAVKSVNPDAIFADELLDAWRENTQGKVLVTRQQLSTALSIQKALLEHPTAGKLLTHPSRAVEVSYFGFDDETGLEVRVRPDLEIDLDGVRIGADLKTISMWNIKQEGLRAKLHREIIDRDYHLSAAMYCETAALDQFFWIFVNKDENYHWIAIIEASAELLELGMLEYRKAMRAIATGFDTGEWPAPITSGNSDEIADYTDELNDFDTRRLEALRTAQGE
ncbi:PD-(D/E)XK nuclease-like domain-containing protein [Escherichia coli]|uniref:PD-(D/E)XK nuclease-like domain-containing protein n=1 Tax=Escherichia coli TaxID=562 RepID=UPI003CFB634A